MPKRTGSWVPAFAAVALRPRLWREALASALRIARPGWWRRVPFLPLPDRGYLAFRLETQYGADGTPDAHDLVTFLEWCRSQRAIMRRARH